MSRQEFSTATDQGSERRCPNCGTRVAQEATTCFMCGHDLRVAPQRGRRVSWVDALLVLAVLGVLAVWWRLGLQSPPPAPEDAVAVDMILPTSIPVLEPTVTATPAPTATPVPTAAPVAPTFTSHTVTAGQTLLGIAGIYGVTVDEIQQANNLSDELIRPGDELVIPVQVSGPVAATQGQTTNFNYTVAGGDTIISIATLFGSTVQDILAANGLGANDVIRPGDELIVPVANVPSEVTAAGPAALPAGDAGGTQTGNPDSIYIEPRLIGPPDQATLSRNETVLLRWVSVDVLQPNEWYVLMLYPSEGAAQVVPSIWTKATSHRLDATYAPPEGASAVYAWQVSVVRVLNDGITRNLEAASPPSALRSFTWE
ncbi:MAG: LysM peptidoglycan-binding domain-containing protein [Caldilineaceae bacterium]|nr:LysM peptidoglycan-binding domain-containing protein [Caldilineaceae bacterium]